MKKLNRQSLLGTFQNDILRVRIESKGVQLIELFILSIDAKEFPDYLRHTPFNSPIKLFQYLQEKRQESLKFIDGQLCFQINKYQSFKLSPHKYQRQNIDAKQYEPVLFDMNTKHANDYIITKGSLQKIQNGWTQITCLKPLSLEKQTNLTIKYNKYGGPWSIGFGIITKNRKNSHYSGDVEDAQSVGYWSRNGYKKGCICHDGKKIYDWDEALFTSEGEMIEFRFNPKDMTVVWRNTMKNINIKLSNSFNHTELYFYVVMYDVGSSIEFNC